MLMACTVPTAFCKEHQMPLNLLPHALSKCLNTYANGKFNYQSSSRILFVKVIKWLIIINVDPAVRNCWINNLFQHLSISVGSNAASFSPHVSAKYVSSYSQNTNFPNSKVKIIFFHNLITKVTSFNWNKIIFTCIHY